MPIGIDDKRILKSRTGLKQSDLSIAINLNDESLALVARQDLDDLEIENSIVYVGDITELTMWLETFNGSISRLLLHVPPSLSDTVLFEQLDQLADHVSETTQVFGFGKCLNAETENHLKHLGFRDYLSDVPLDTAIKKCLAVSIPEHRDRAASGIAVMGVAGGVGASLFCLSLAEQIVCHAGMPATIIDGQMPDRAIAHLIGTPKNLKRSVFQSYNESEIADRIHLLDFYDHPSIEFRSTADKRDRLASVDAHWPNDGIVIIDCSFTTISREVLSRCTDIIFVTEPDLKCLNALTWHLETILPNIGHTRIHIALNKIGMPGRVEFDKSSFTFERAFVPIEFYKYLPRAVSASLAKVYAAIPSQSLKDANAFKTLLARLDIIRRDIQSTPNLLRQMVQKIMTRSVFR